MEKLALQVSVFFQARFIIPINREQDVSAGFSAGSISHTISIAIESPEEICIFQIVDGLGCKRNKMEVAGSCTDPGAFGWWKFLICRLSAGAVIRISERNRVIEIGEVALSGN